MRTSIDSSRFSRIEAFVESLEESIEQMEESEFKSHVEALATKRLEKPKQMAAKVRTNSQSLEDTGTLCIKQLQPNTLRFTTFKAFYTWF